MDAACFVQMLVLAGRCIDAQLVVDERNVHLLVLASATIAAKLHEDEPFALSYVAEHAEVPLKALVEAEHCVFDVLLTMRRGLTVDTRDFNECVRALTDPPVVDVTDGAGLVDHRQAMRAAANAAYAACVEENERAG